MSEIRGFPVPKKSVAIWWLGQNGYIFKTSGGALLSTDMYLTDSCARLGADAGLNLARRVPVLIRPEELDVDLYACTHNHMDHTDPALVHLAKITPDRRRAHSEGVGEIHDIAGAVLPQMLQQPALSIEAQHGHSVSQ